MMKKTLLATLVAISMMCMSACDKKPPQFVAKEESIPDTTRHFDEEIPSNREARRRERLNKRSSKKNRVITFTTKKQRDRLPHAY